MTRQFLTANIHNPRVERVVMMDGKIHISMGNDEFNGSVAIICTPDTWNQMVDDVYRLLAKNEEITA